MTPPGTLTPGKTEESEGVEAYSKAYWLAPNLASGHMKQEAKGRQKWGQSKCLQI